MTTAETNHPLDAMPVWGRIALARDPWTRGRAVGRWWREGDTILFRLAEWDGTPIAALPDDIMPCVFKDTLRTDWPQAR